MANPRRGEIEAVIDGRPRTLCLTLGALAELEAAFGVDDVVALADRFGSGRPSARDLTRLLAAGLRGAGEAVSEDEVALMRFEGGAVGAAEIAGRLLAATFGTAGDAREDTARGGEVEGGGGRTPSRPPPGPGSP